MKKKGVELTLTQIILFIIALVLIFIIAKIVIDVKFKGVELIDSLKNIFIFGNTG